MSYIQMTHLERYQIHALRGANYTLSDIATELSRHTSTISRELKRNQARWATCLLTLAGLLLRLAKPTALEQVHSPR